MLKSFQYISLLLIFLLVLSCAETSSDAPSDTSAHQLDWLDPQADTFHGTEVIEEGISSCVFCHAPELTGSGSSSSCFNCHFDEYGSRIPEGSDWFHGLILHTQQVESADTCNNCHNTYQKFGLPPAECHNCHGHPLGQDWMDNKSLTFHGDAAINNLASCEACHGDDYQGGFTGIGCYQCHFDETGSRTPFPSMWTHSSDHDKADLTFYEDICNQCHNTNRLYGNAPQSEDCHDCHTHDSSVEWLLRSNHAQSAVSDPGLCQVCHAPLDCRVCHVRSDPLFVVTACTSCHDNRPETGMHIKEDDHVVSCNKCHFEAGAETLNHYDSSTPADVFFEAANMTYNPSAKTCIGTCHQENHDSDYTWDASGD